MSITELEEQKDKILDQIEALEEKCDTLPMCEEPDSCKTCEAYTKIEGLTTKVEELETKIEEMTQAEEEE